MASKRPTQKLGAIHLCLHNDDFRLVVLERGTSVQTFSNLPYFGF